ncbi:MAG: hypothetical protein JWN46_1690, partial [Acidimicrobiales bacterium]|nr:hypothetical protein [Acidimicrobiales bacterium]
GGAGGAARAVADRVEQRSAAGSESEPATMAGPSRAEQPSER